MSKVGCTFYFTSNHTRSLLHKILQPGKILFQVVYMTDESHGIKAKIWGKLV
ncbi:hypothetical protein K438DRAFT_1160870 [Mycena galopus ATCC 62051]|nr:hypothetical protein K438DRAFT_1160870 [Mycena galopus ATCC 62051]